MKVEIESKEGFRLSLASDGFETVKIELWRDEFVTRFTCKALDLVAALDALMAAEWRHLTGQRAPTSESIFRKD